MKQINFLPPTIQEKARNRQYLSALAFVVLVALLGNGLMWYVLSTEKSSLEAHLSVAPSTQAPASTTAATVLTSDTARRVTVLNTLSASDVNWSRALGLVGSLTPKDVVLTTYSYTFAQSTPTLKLAGTAPSNVSFASYVATLQADRRLAAAPKVDGYSYSAATGTVTFSMTLSVNRDQVAYQP